MRKALTYLGWGVTACFRIFLLAAGFMGSLSASFSAKAQITAVPTLSFTTLGARQTIYKWLGNTCAEKYIPDGPARMFRRADGSYELMAEEADNWRMVGTSPFTLKVSCPAILSSNEYGLLNRGYVGIQATYTEDGQNVYGFAGQDLSPIIYAQGCVDNGGGNCWVNDIQAVVSSDMGNTFNFRTSTNGDVAASTHDLSLPRKFLEGYFTSSNIVKRAGYYYMLVFTDSNVTSQSKTCLIRTNNLQDISSWRGYDGQGFTAALEPVGGSDAIPCAAVGSYSLWPQVTSLSYIPRKNIYVAVFQNRLQLAGDIAQVPGAYYATSPDLIQWTPTQRLMSLPQQPGIDSTIESDAYPVLIDPFSKTRNFETIDSATPYLMFTSIHLGDQYNTLNRDLVAIPLLMH